MTAIGGTGGIFLGLVGAELYLNPILAGQAVAYTEAGNLGAEILPLADAYSEVDPKLGREFNKLLRAHKRALKKGEREDSYSSPKSRMAVLIADTPDKKWKKIIERLRKHPWAFAGGWLATPPASTWKLIDALSSSCAKHSARIPEIRKMIEKSLVSWGLSKIVHLGFDWSWPAGDPLNISPDLIKAAHDRGRSLVALIGLPAESRSIAVYLHLKRDGKWGLYYFSCVSGKTIPVPGWRGLRLNTQMFELGLDHSSTLYDEFAGSWNAEMQPMRARHVTELGDDYRQRIEERLLQTDRPEVRNFKWRAENFPVLSNWLALDVRRDVKIPASVIAKGMEGRFRSDIAMLLKPVMLLKGVAGQPNARFTALRYNEVLAAMGFVPVRENEPCSVIEKEAGFIVPRVIRPMAEHDAAGAAAFLEELKLLGIMSGDDADTATKGLDEALQISHDYQLLKGKKNITFQLSLWKRDPRFDGKLDLNDEIYLDPGYQVLTLRLPNGEILAGLVMRLMAPIDGEPELYWNWSYVHKGLHHWTNSDVDDIVAPIVNDAVNSIAARMKVMAGGLVDRLEDMNWMSGFIPVSAPFEAERAAAKLFGEWPHPARYLLPTGVGNTEVMRPIEGAELLMFNPHLSFTLPIPDVHSPSMEPSPVWGHSNINIKPWAVNVDAVFHSVVEKFLFREIDPKPDPARSDDYVFGFSTGTGRSVDYSIREYVTAGGARWHYLDAIGVGKTMKARSGTEARDGLLPLEGAQRRFYLTMLMDAIAGKYGFRTSLGVAVVNRNRIRESGEKRPGMPQIQATLYEIRREQLRLADLEQTASPEKMVAMVKKNIARELKKEDMSDEEYVTWLAKTLGEQLAIMTYFGFDHGKFEDTLQLGGWNISLAGEIFDFDASRMSRPRVVAPLYMNDQPFSLMSVDIMQMNHSGWLGVLLKLAPGVNFSSIMFKGYVDKEGELREKKVDPRAEIRRFNVEHWNPYMRRLGRNAGKIYERVSRP